MGVGSRRHARREALGSLAPPGVWHLGSRGSQGLQDVWPSGTWAPGGDANLARWLRPASAKAPEQSQSMKHTLVVGAGSLPSPRRRGVGTQPGDRVGVCSAAPGAREGLQGRGSGSPTEGSSVCGVWGGGIWGSCGVPDPPGKPEWGLGRFPRCKCSHRPRGAGGAPLHSAGWMRGSLGLQPRSPQPTARPLPGPSEGAPGSLLVWGGRR